MGLSVSHAHDHVSRPPQSSEDASTHTRSTTLGLQVPHLNPQEDSSYHQAQPWKEPELYRP